MSSNITEDHLDSTSEGILRPRAPEPTASNDAVQAFLVQFFRALCCNRTLREAKQMAEKVHADGVALYEIPEKEWLDGFGNEGRTIYRALQINKYGYPRITMVGATLVFTGSFEGLLEFWWKKDSRTFIFPIICTTLTVLFGIINLYCRTQTAHDKGWIPEGFKIRRGRGS